MQLIEFSCPICKGPLQHGSGVYTCARDQRQYPVTFDFPDFRVRPYGSASDAEYNLTKRLLAEYSNRSFLELVDLYESLISAAPSGVHAKRRIHLTTGVVRSQSCLADIACYQASSPCGQFLEIGCGPGGFLVAAAQTFRCVVGLDISMSRLVLAKKRLEEAGRETILICAAAEALPFPNDSFDLVVASDVIEHVWEQDRVMHESYRVLAPGGALFLATPNRWSLTPEPHVNVWGVGFLPKAWRAHYVRLVRKIGYGNVTLLNWFEIRRLLLQTPFTQWDIKAPTLPPEHIARLPVWARTAAPIYHWIKERPLLQWLVYLFGPLFHVICVKKSA